MVQKFEDLIAWQKAKSFCIDIYTNFSKNHDRNFSRQIQSAALSITNNIAEGFDKGSKKEFGRYLSISKGSCSEVKSMLYLASELNYLDQHTFKILHFRSEEIARIISGLIKSLNR